jgi:hypothetical protein
MFLFTADLLEMSAALLDAIEDTMPKLSIAAGRNELMAPQQALLDALRSSDGMLPEKQVYIRMEAEMTRVETWAVIDHLEKTDQIIKKELVYKNKLTQAVVKKVMLMLPEKFEELKQKGLIK